MPVFNALLVRWADGYLEVEDAVSVAAVGRHETLLTLSDTRSEEEATRIAEATLDMHARVRVAVEANVEPRDLVNADLPYEGFDIGDTVTIDDETDSPTTTRVTAISVSEDTEGGVIWNPEFGDIIDQPGVRQTRWLGRMVNGTLTGKSESAQPLTNPVLDREQLAVLGGAKPYATFVVAASDSVAPGADSADYICDATNAATAINQAIAALPADQDGRILLLEGTYPCTSPIQMDGEMVLEGQGDVSRITTSSGINVIEAINNGNTIQNLSIQMAGASEYIEALQVGINFTEAGRTNNHVRNVRISGTGSGIIHLDTPDVEIVGCYIAVTIYGVYIYRPRGVLIADTAIIGADQGLYCHDPGESGDLDHGTVIGCRFQDCLTYSIFTRTRQLVIVGNHFRGDTAVHVGCYQFNFGDGQQLGALIEGNQFFDGDIGVDMEECHHNDVIGNRFVGQTTYGVSIHDGSDNNAVKSNRFLNCGTGVDINANQTDANVIGGNTFRGCTTDINNLGAGTLQYDNV